MNSQELRRVLKKAKLTQRQLAREMGVTDTAVSLWVSGKRKMHPVFARVIRQIAEDKRAS